MYEWSCVVNFYSLLLSFDYLCSLYKDWYSRAGLQELLTHSLVANYKQDSTTAKATDFIKTILNAKDSKLNLFIVLYPLMQLVNFCVMFWIFPSCFPLLMMHCFSEAGKSIRPRITREELQSPTKEFMDLLKPIGVIEVAKPNNLWI